MDFEESPDEDDVFFLDGPVHAETSTDGDMSLETVDASEESMEAVRCSSPERVNRSLAIQSAAREEDFADFLAAFLVVFWDRSFDECDTFLVVEDSLVDVCAPAP